MMFMAQEPQMPSRHERRKVRVGSISFLILMRASKICAPYHKDEHRDVYWQKAHALADEGIERTD